MTFSSFLLQVPKTQHTSTSLQALWQDLKWLLVGQVDVPIHLSEQELMQDLQQGRLNPTPIAGTFVEK